MHFLFSFGSNMDTAQLLRRAPHADILGTAVVHGFRLAFGGFSLARDGAVATMERGGEKARCSGVVAALNDADLIAMDGYEGAGYERVLVEARPRSGALAGGSPMMVQTYLLRRSRVWLPAPSYVGIIARAYATWGFDVAPLTAAVNRSVRATQQARSAAERRENARIARLRRHMSGHLPHLAVQPRLPVLDTFEDAVDDEDADAAEARRRTERLAVLGVVRGRTR